MTDCVWRQSSDGHCGTETETVNAKGQKHRQTVVKSVDSDNIMTE